MSEQTPMGSWAHLNPPPSAFLSAFNLSGQPRPLIGGQGESWLLEQLVLKPTDSSQLTEFYCQTQYKVLIEQARLIETGSSSASLFRLPNPVPIPGSKPPTYVFHGWTANQFIDGESDPTHRIRIGDVLPAARAFHDILQTIVQTPHPSMLARTDRWTQADRFAWDEITLSDPPSVSQSLLAKLKPYLDRLNAIKKQITLGDNHSQLIHGDLSGNILFPTTSHPNLALGILDFVGYWRPVAYAEAIMVADGLTWQGGGRDMIEIVGISEFRIQMLIRALIFRIATYCIDTDMAFVERNLPNMNCEHAIMVVEEIVHEMETESPADLASGWEAIREARVLLVTGKPQTFSR